MMLGRTWEAGSSHRYGFNTQERIDDLGSEGGHYSALYWEYDTRICVRWNTDPVVKYYESPYSTFGRNPIWYNDWLGNDSIVYDQSGNELSRISVPDKLVSKTDDYGITRSWSEKVPDVYFVAFEDGDKDVNGISSYQALSYESIFGDATDNSIKSGASNDIFTKLDKVKVSSTEKANKLVENKMYRGRT